ncbi:ComEC/Rec2 family competence protein [Maribacter algicola]|uniref:ComEC/Rec2 family competence protein n=1 Tax=Meishania litoralis TaxID=3434685 RepID=A0ACC7LJS6_9FLAO
MRIRMNSNVKIIGLLIIVLLLSRCKKRTNQDIFSVGYTISKEPNISPWQEGYLDIHHINTGSGDATFFVFPDGTTMLFDAGNLDKEKFEKKYAPLKATTPIPNDSQTTAQWIARYIEKVMPIEWKDSIDYALISHFHEDHYGSIIDLGNEIPYGKIIDRNSPDLNFPLDLSSHLKEDELFQNYRSFIAKEDIPTEALMVGSDKQIHLLNDQNRYPTFRVRNVKSNATIWTGTEDETFEYFTAEEMTDFYKGSYNENPLSLALKISYGDFDYFTGGDNTGLQGFGLPEWFDVETPMAKVVGPVEVTTLNHHGNRDATNEFFVKTLDPKVVVQQSWCSDHPGQEVYQRLIYQNNTTGERDIFSTNMHSETLVTYGPWFRENYKSLQGHIVIRVAPNGNIYKVFVLDESSMDVKQEYGPYQSR